MISVRPNTPSDKGLSPAHERIIQSYREIQKGSGSAPWKRLGVRSDDTKAQKALLPILKALKSMDLPINPIPRESEDDHIRKGVFYVGDSGNPIGYFKLGRERAATETLARQIAHMLGLGEYVVPGIFCAVKGFEPMPPIEEEDEPVVEGLWNGRIKVYCQESECGPSLKTTDTVNRYVVGILEPAITPQKEVSILDFFLMTLTIAALGGRDIKRRDIREPVVLDLEDTLPKWIDPKEPNNTCAALDLRYLANDERALTRLSRENLESIYDIVSAWDINAIISELNKKTIKYADRTAENDSNSNRPFLDEGMNPVNIDNEQYPHPVNGFFDRWTQNRKKKLLSQEQLDALRVRLERAKQYITDANINQKPVCALDLVFAIDPYAKKLAEMIDRMPEGSPTKRKIYFEGSPASLAGIANRRLICSLSIDEQDERWTPLGISWGRVNCLTPNDELRRLNSSTLSLGERSGSVLEKGQEH